MATTPVNNSKLLSPLTSPKPQDAGKAKNAKGADALAGVQGAPTAAGAASKPNAAAVNISSGAKDRAEAHQKALEIARKTPDIREDRVAALKAQIDAGTYQVDSGKIADGMMREAIKEHLAEMEDR